MEQNKGSNITESAGSELLLSLARYDQELSDLKKRIYASVQQDRVNEIWSKSKEISTQTELLSIRFCVLMELMVRDPDSFNIDEIAILWHQSILDVRQQLGQIAKERFCEYEYSDATLHSITKQLLALSHEADDNLAEFIRMVESAYQEMFGYDLRIFAMQLDIQ